MARPAAVSQPRSPAALYVLTCFFSLLAASISTEVARSTLFTGADLWIDPLWAWLFSIAVAIGVGALFAHVYTEDLVTASSPGPVYCKASLASLFATLGVIVGVTIVLYIVAGLILLLAAALAVIFFAHSD